MLLVLMNKANLYKTHVVKILMFNSNSGCEVIPERGKHSCCERGAVHRTYIWGDINADSVWFPQVYTSLSVRFHFPLSQSTSLINYNSVIHADRLALGATMAHEMMHAWMRIEGDVLFLGLSNRKNKMNQVCWLWCTIWIWVNRVQSRTKKRSEWRSVSSNGT